MGRVTAIFAEGDNLAEGRHERSVVARAMEHLRKPRDGGEVLLLTHAAHQRLPYVHRRHDWHLVYDEAPQAVWCHELNVPDTHRMLTDAISTEEFNPEYLRVEARERQRLRAFAANRNADDIYGLLSPVANVLLSRHWQAFVDAEQFNNALDAHGSKRKLSFHATLLPSLMEGYRSATVLAADAGETALVHLWAGRVRFREARHLDRHLRYTTHPNGSLLTVEYISEEDWSKRHRDKRAEDGRPLLDHAVEAVRRRFGEAEFAWMGNLDLGDDLFVDARATRLPNTSHGLNSFMHLHNAALLSALNPPPAHFAFLDSIGIGGDAVRTALYRQAIYQAVCRTSLRDPTDATPKCVVVPDRATAAWLAEKFPGCQVGAIAGVPALAKGRKGRPRLHESPAMRDRQHREAERDRLLADVLALRKQELERQREITPGQAGLQAGRQRGITPGKRDRKPSASTNSRRQARRQYLILVAMKTGKAVWFVNESVEDKVDDNKLKSILGSRTLWTEPKGLQKFEVSNTAWLIVAGNSPMGSVRVANSSVDRRYSIIRTGGALVARVRAEFGLQDDRAAADWIADEGAALLSDPVQVGRWLRVMGERHGAVDRVAAFHGDDYKALLKAQQPFHESLFEAVFRADGFRYVRKPLLYLMYADLCRRLNNGYGLMKNRGFYVHLRTWAEREGVRLVERNAKWNTRSLLGEKRDDHGRRHLSRRQGARRGRARRQRPREVAARRLEARA